MPVPPPWRTLVVSPHFDDAALSLAGLLPTLPGPLAVVTVHGGPPPPGSPVSWWDSVCGFTTAAEAHRVRSAEDARACELLGAEQVLIDHPDGPYVTEGEGPDALDALLGTLAPTTRVLLPLGTNQPDHEAVRLRAERALTAAGAPAPWIYADLPYTGHLPEWGTPEASGALAASQKWGTAYQELTRRHRVAVERELVLSDEQWAAKRAAVLSHASQLAALAPDHGTFHARTGPLRAELIWSLEPHGTA